MVQAVPATVFGTRQRADSTSSQDGLSNSSAGRVAVETDRTDMTWIVVGMVLMAVLYAMTGVCAHMDLPEGEETLAERYAHALSNRWPRALSEVFKNSLPAICGKLLGQTLDMPFLVPIGPLEAKGLFHLHSSWSIDILSNAKKLMFTASLSEDSRGKPFLLQISFKGEKCACIDGRLTIFNAKGEPFGRLIKEPSGEFVLEEASSGRTSWTISTREEGNRRDLLRLGMTVTWRPKGQLLATAARGQRRDGKSSEYLKVTNSPGVDMVLVLVSVLGVIAFDISPRIAESKRSLKGIVEGLEQEATGIASSLLSRFQH